MHQSRPRKAPSKHQDKNPTDKDKNPTTKDIDNDKNLKDKEVQVGKTKLFTRGHVRRSLEHLRTAAFKRAAIH